MKLYFIRHAQTALDGTGVHRDQYVNLSLEGREQARLTGEYLKQFPIDHILTSPYTRAVQTAQIIATLREKTFTATQLLCEMQRPSELLGKKYNDKAAQKIIRIVKKNMHNSRFRFSDEETFFEAKHRAFSLLSFLEEQESGSFVLVTHGDFLKMLLASLRHGESLAPKQYLKMHKNILLENAGITEISYDLDKGWSIEKINETKHLVERTEQISPPTNTFFA